MNRRLATLLVLALALAALGAGSGSTAETPTASASAYAISVVVPGQGGASAGGASAPGAADTSVGDAFVYPADGSVVRTGALSSSASALTDAGAASFAVTDVLGISLFNGEITIDSVAGRARASSFAADTTGSAVTNVVALGQAVGVAPNQRVALGDWGTLTLLEGAAERSAGATVTGRASVTAVRVSLSAEHAGLPAGTEILIGHAETAIAAPAPTAEPPITTIAEPQPAKPRATPGRTGKGAKLPKPPEPGKDPVPKVRTPPTDISAPLSPGGYVFPVYGPSSFSDTYGAARGRRDVASRCRHLRPPRRPDPCDRRRHRLLRGLERHRRLSLLVAGPFRQPVLLRPPLGVLAARRERQRGEGRAGDRVRRQHRRRGKAPRTTSISRFIRWHCCRSATTGS